MLSSARIDGRIGHPCERTGVAHALGIQRNGGGGKEFMGPGFRFGSADGALDGRLKRPGKAASYRSSPTQRIIGSAMRHDCRAATTYAYSISAAGSKKPSVKDRLAAGAIKRGKRA